MSIGAQPGSGPEPQEPNKLETLFGKAKTRRRNC